MSHPSRLSSPRLRRLLLACLASIPLGFACSSDEEAPEAPITFSLELATLDGAKLGNPVDLHCDGTLAVEVALGSNPQDRPFILRPSQACGASGRCGYVRITGLTSSGEVLASVDTATPVGLLRLPTERLAELTEITAQLIRGTDNEPLLNPDQTEVTASATPTFQLPTDCSLPDPGMGGAGGAAAGPVGGAGGDASGPVGGSPGTGGAPSEGGSGSEGGNAAAGGPSSDAGAGGQG